MLFCRSRLLALSVFANIVCLFLAPEPAAAGGGPENVFLVANLRSCASISIAHHFAALRQIPSLNILYLDWPYPTDNCDIGVFREKLLMPVLGAIQARGISPQIDYLVYSSDFPTTIDFKSELEGRQIEDQRKPTGSLTSLTYFAMSVVGRQLQTLDPNGNHYMRRPASGKVEPDSQGFRTWYGFDSAGKLREGGGDSYLLSMMLGVTSGYGMSADEVIQGLERSAAADGTKPKGTIYFCKSGDAARSPPREPLFPAAIAALKKLGINAQVVSGKLPQGKDDVLGLVTGTRDFDWPASKSTILPGAICENLTSNGAIFGPNDQTRLTEFLRYGAAGSSGTVIEPYAIHQKFPAAFVQLHYARGCTLAEAFYQSISMPYQLLIVGDPLCRPWANIPTVEVDGVVPGSTLKGRVSLRPSGEVEGGKVDRFELFIDGYQVDRCAADDTFEFDTADFPDGAAELRVVGIESGPIQTQGRVILPIKINNHGRKIDFTCSADDTATWKTKIKLAAEAPGAQTIGVFEGMRSLGTIRTEKGEIEIDPIMLGTGPVVLRARAQFSEKAKDAVLSTPIKLTVKPNAPIQARKLRAGTKLAPGLRFLVDGEKRAKVIPVTNDRKWLEDTGAKGDQKFTLASIFEVPKDGLYQFETKHVGALSIKIDGQKIFDIKQTEPSWYYSSVPLAAGLHEFELKAEASQPSGMDIRFGGPGATYLDGKQFRHPAP
jgi:hypothetical protein